MHSLTWYDKAGFHQVESEDKNALTTLALALVHVGDAQRVQVRIEGSVINYK